MTSENYLQAKFTDFLFHALGCIWVRAKARVRYRSPLSLEVRALCLLLVAGSPVDEDEGYAPALVLEAKLLVTAVLAVSLRLRSSTKRDEG
jgi:hypothetical protein